MMGRNANELMEEALARALNREKQGSILSLIASSVMFIAVGFFAMAGLSLIALVLGVAGFGQADVSVIVFGSMFTLPFANW